ncbi:hypothetical protein [Endozoicomonas lisbonensis]|uniref:Uncharacterized protein n=1 Tax=Endozoicomonas lisbonensis TaxID=3120522 RepID=A0ABV2SN65_9GAMM
MARSGRVWIAAELGEELGVKGIDGSQPPSHRAFLGEPAEPSPAIVE